MSSSVIPVLHKVYVEYGLAHQAVSKRAEASQIPGEIYQNNLTVGHFLDLAHSWERLPALDSLWTI